MTMRLPHVCFLMLVVMLTSPLWILPLLEILVLTLGAVVWLVVLVFELVGI